MKKLICVIAAALHLIVLCAPVFAADANAKISYIPSATYEVKEADTEGGIHLEIRETDPDTVNEKGLIETASRNEKVKEAGELAGYDVLDIVIVRDSDGEVIEWNDPITVVITYDKSSRVIAVFVQNEDEEQTWEEVPYEIGDDNLITLHMPHLSTVAFTISELTPAPPQTTPTPGATPGANPGTTNPGGTTTSTSTRVGSPQTGYNTCLLWLFAAGSCILAGAMCFMKVQRIKD